jgi:hypothetical protein
MKFTQEKALLHLTGKSALVDLKMETIEKLVNEYPYFSPGQYLFSAKLRNEDHPLAVAQAVKTALFFPNPHWLQFQLDSINEVAIDEAPRNEMDTAILRSIYQKDKEWDDVINLVNTNEITEEPTSQWKPEVMPIEQPEANLSAISIPTIESIRQMMKGIDGSSSTQIIETEGHKKEEVIEDKEETLAFLPVFSAIASSELQPEQEYSEQPETATILKDQEKSDAKIASLLSSQFAEFKKPLEQDAQLEIENFQEKLHTIDYFASQGIQIDLSKIPQDKLTTKLRRFTDWLKDMKNHHPNPTDLGTSPESEKKAAETALISNESKEILTETMAEVLVKQGQVDKAIQLFIKLSFSNPEKSAYFAEKIQQLKGI